MTAVAASPVWPAALPDHLSASQVTLFERCPEAYRQRYVQKKQERIGASLIVGWADHSAYELYFRERMRGVTPPLKDVEQRFATALDDQIEKYGGVSEIFWDEKDDGHRDPASAQAKGLVLVRAYYKVADRVDPIQVEEKFEYTTPSLPIAIHGRIDVETAETVVERKRSKALKHEPEPKHRLQNMIYRAEKRKPVETHFSVETKNPYAVTPVEQPGLLSPFYDTLPALVEKYVGRIAQSMHAMMALHGPDDYWPGALEHPWACGYCGFKRNCAWWGNT